MQVDVGNLLCSNLRRIIILIFVISYCVLMRQMTKKLFNNMIRSSNNKKRRKCDEKNYILISVCNTYLQNVFEQSITLDKGISQKGDLSNLEYNLNWVHARLLRMKM